MKKIAAIFLLFLVFACKPKPDYLSIVESEISNLISHEFILNETNYWTEIENLFVDYVNNRDTLSDATDYPCEMQAYLNCIVSCGYGEWLDSTMLDRFLALRENLIEINLLTVDGVNYNRIYSLYKPLVDRYRTELEEIVKQKPEIVYYIGTINPDSTKFSPSMTALAVLEQNSCEDMQRPGFHESILLTVFCEQIYYSYKIKENQEQELRDSLYRNDKFVEELILEDTE